MTTASPQHVQARQIQALIEPVAAALGLDVESVSVRRAGRRSSLVILVDKDGGVRLDDVAEVSRRISDALDAEDVFGASPYVLEVSSPGVDRPLTMPRHWRRNIGRLVDVGLRPGGSVLGRVVGCDDEAVQIDADGTVRALRYEEVGRAVVQVEFGGPAAQPGGGTPEADTPDPRSPDVETTDEET